jgi:Type II secretion system (T2SS), protein M subtype b
MKFGEHASEKLLQLAGPGLAMVLAALFYLGVQELKQQNQEALVELQQQLHTARSWAGKEAELKQVLERDRQSLSSLVFQPQTSEALNANVITIVGQIAAKTGVSIVRAGNLPENKTETLNFVRTQFELTGTNNAVLDFLVQVSASRPTLYLDGLKISASPVDQQDPAVEEPVSADITLSAAVLVPEKAKPPS